MADNNTNASTAHAAAVPTSNAPAPSNPGPVDTLPFPFRNCPICNVYIITTWQEHMCPLVRALRGSNVENVVQTWARTKAAAATLERILGKGAGFLPIKELEIKIDNHQNITEADQAEEALHSMNRGFNKVTQYLFESGDSRFQSLAAHWLTTLTRRGYGYKLTGPEMLLVHGIPDGEAFLHQYLIALELQSWGWGRRMGNHIDPFEREIVSAYHRVRRSELEGMNAPFMTYRGIMHVWDLSETLKFLEKNRPADILDPPLIRPRWMIPYRLPLLEERMGSGMPVNRRDSIFIQLVLKIEAMLNLISTDTARDVCASRALIIPEEIVRVIQENAVTKLVKSNRRISQAIATGETLAPFIDTLETHVRQLMDALENEPPYKRLFSSMFEGLFDVLSYKEVLRDRHRAADELRYLRPAATWLLEQCNRRIWKNHRSLMPNPAASLPNHIPPALSWRLLGRDLQRAFVKNDDQEGEQVSEKTMRANIDTIENLKTIVVSMKEFHRYVDNQECPLNPLTIFRFRRMSAPEIFPDAVEAMLRYPTPERQKKLRRRSISQADAGHTLWPEPRLDVSYLEESVHGNGSQQKEMKETREHVIRELFASENFGRGPEDCIPDPRLPNERIRLYFEEYDVDEFELDDTAV